MTVIPWSHVMTSVTGNRGRAGSGLAPLVYSFAHEEATLLLRLNLGSNRPPTAYVLGVLLW